MARAAEVMDRHQIPDRALAQDLAQARWAHGRRSVFPLRRVLRAVGCQAFLARTAAHEQRKCEEHDPEADADERERLLPAAGLDQPAEERREYHGPRSERGPVDAHRESHVPMEPARHDHRQQHAECRVPHRADEQSVEEIELPQFLDRPEQDRADRIRIEAPSMSGRAP